MSEILQAHQFRFIFAPAQTSHASRHIVVLSGRRYTSSQARRHEVKESTQLEG
jgi:hypothetical protein